MPTGRKEHAPLPWFPAQVAFVPGFLESGAQVFTETLRLPQLIFEFLHLLLRRPCVTVCGVQPVHQRCSLALKTVTTLVHRIFFAFLASLLSLNFSGSLVNPFVEFLDTSPLRKE